MKPGARAEQLVAQIERALGDQGSVTTNEKLPDRDGRPREADVCVRFSQGGRDFIVVIEVRDRSKRDDLQWIDQVDGKWRGTPYRVVAVSAAGFSPQALEKSREVGIETLTFHESNTLAWPISLGTTHFSVIRPVVSMSKVNIHLADTTDADPALLSDLPCSPTAAMFKNRDHDPLTLLRLWDLNVRPRVHPEQYVRDEPRQTYHIQLQITDQEPLWLSHRGLELPLAALEIWAECGVEEQQVPFLPAREYAEADGGALRSGIFETEQPVSIGERSVYVSFVYTPAEADSEGDKLSVLLRDAAPPSGASEG